MCGFVWVDGYPEVCEGCGERYLPRSISRGWDCGTQSFYVWHHTCGHDWHGFPPLLKRHQRCSDPGCPAKTRP